MSFSPIHADGIIHTPLENSIGEFRRDQANCRRVRVAPGKRAGIGEIRQVWLDEMVEESLKRIAWRVRSAPVNNLDPPDIEERFAI